MGYILSVYELSALCFLFLILGWSLCWLYDGNLKLFLKIRKERKNKKEDKKDVKKESRKEDEEN